MRFYISKNNTRLNGRPFEPEKISPYLCLNPYYKAEFARPANILLDSGAFQDVDKNLRLSFKDALERQLAYEEKIGFQSEKIVSYDMLVDEQMIDGKKVKQRWEYENSFYAVGQTVGAAAYLSSQRHKLGNRKLVLSCQGVTINQYVECAKSVLHYATNDDVFGFGGFCIIGKKQNSITLDDITYPEQFAEIVRQTMPFIHAKGVKSVHVFGVMHIPSLRILEQVANQYGIMASTDSSSIERNSVIEGKIWTDEGFRIKLGRDKKYTGSDPVPDGFWHPNVLAHENIIRAVDTLRRVGSL